MKVVFHRGTKGIGSARHNSRNYDYKNLSKHIDPERTEKNKYLCIYPELKNNFPKAEEKFYKEYLQGALDERNDKYIKAGKKKHVKTMKQFMNMARYKPQETIIQIGDVGDHGTKKDIMKLYNELERYSNEITKGHCKTIDVAIHFDESTPHAHVRQVWLYEDLNSKGEKIYKIGKEEAMKRAGIELPFPDEPEGRYNNRTMTYTKLMRDRAEEFCRERGLDIDVNRERRPHLSKQRYINKKIKEERERNLKRKDINK